MLSKLMLSLKIDRGQAVLCPWAGK